MDWKGYLDQVGEMANVPGLGELIDVEAAIEMGEMMMQAQVQGAEQSDTQQPALGRQMGNNGRKGGSQGLRPRAAQSQGIGRLNGSGANGSTEGFNTGADLGATQR